RQPTQLNRAFPVLVLVLVAVLDQDRTSTRTATRTRTRTRTGSDYLLGAVRIAIRAAPAFFAIDMTSTAAPSWTFLSPRMSSVSPPTSASAFRISASRFAGSTLREPR